MNLVDNAAKFTAEGHIVLRTCVEEERDESIAIQFAVEDTGIGSLRISNRSFLNRLDKPMARPHVNLAEPDSDWLSLNDS